MRRLRQTVNQKGFTLVELILAMSLFATIMVISTAGFIAMNRSFTRGTVRKQLSEAVQRTTEDITRTLRSMPQSKTNSKFCNLESLSCPRSKDWNLICFSGARYFWPTDTNAGSLYRDSKPCSDSIATGVAEQLVDDRYQVLNLEVKPVTSSQEVSLFSVAGVFRTLDKAAFNIENPTKEQLKSLRCKGGALSSAVRTCAIEHFQFTINARGQAI